LERRLVKSIAVMSLILCLSWVLFAVRAREPDYLDDAWHHARDTQNACFLVCFFVCPLLALMLCILWAYFGYFRRMNWELVAVFLPSLCCVVLPWINWWSYGKLFGQEAESYDMKGFEGIVCLYLDAITTCVCLFVPLRIQWKLISPIFGWLSFSSSALILGSPFPDHVRERIFFLGVLTLCALWGAWQNERDSRQGWIAQGRVQKKSEELVQYHVGLSRIMERLSDCLVCLASDFTILERNPRLAALLLHRSADALTGTKFLDYMASNEDQDRFSQALQMTPRSLAASESEVLGGMLHLNLRDACNREFMVYAYYAGIHQSESACSYFIALVEAQDRGAPELEEGSMPLPLEGQVSRQYESEGAIASAGASCSNSIPPAEIAASIDAMHDDLLIVSCTPGFTALGPMMVGAGLRRMIDGDVEEFRSWVERCCNVVANDMLDQYTVQPFHIRLKPIPHSHVRISGECMPDFQAPFDNTAHSDDRDAFLLRIVLTNLTYYRERRQRRPHPRTRQVIGRLQSL